MISDRCPHCHRPFAAPDEDVVVACPGCRRPVRLGLARRIRAAEDLKRALDSEADLDPVLRSQVDAAIQTRLAVLRAVARDVKFSDAPVGPDLPGPAVEIREPVPTEAPAVVEVMPTPPLVEAPTPRPRRRGPPVKPKGPSVWARLGPAFGENLLFVLAAFLLIAGAIYFVTTAWNRWGDDLRLLVIVGGLELLGVVLFAAGRLLNRGGHLPEVERVLVVVVAFLLPLALAVTGELLTESTLLGLVAAVVILPSGWAAVRAAARDTDHALASFLPLGVTALSAPGLLAPWLGGFSVGASSLVAIGLVVAMALGCRTVLGRVTAPVKSAAWVPLLLAFAAGIVAGALAVAAAEAGAGTAATVAPLGVAIAGIGVATVWLERGLVRASHLASRRSTAMLVSALAMGVTGLVMALGSETAILAASLGCAIVGIRFGLGLDRPRLILPGLVASAIAYLHLPSPVREITMALRDEAKEALGYASQPLPYSFYGIAWLPYVAAGAIAALALRKRGREELSGVILGWTLAVASGLGVLAFAAGDDLRAPAGVLLGQGVLLVVVGLLGRDRRLVLGGALGVFGGAACGSAEYAHSHGTTVLILAWLGFTALLPAIFHAIRTGGKTPPSKETNALTDATALMVFLLGSVIACANLPHWIDGTGQPAATAAHVLGYAVLSALAGVLGSAYRRPEGGLAATIMMVAAVESALATLGAGFLTALRPSMLALLSLAPVVAFMLRRSLVPPLRPGLESRGLAAWGPSAWGLPAAGAFVVQSVLILAALRAVALERVELSLALPVFMGGVVVLIGAVLAGRVWAAWAGALQVGLSGALLAGALGHEILALPAAAGLALTTLLLALVGTETARRRGPFVHVIRPVLSTASALVVLLLIWLVVRLSVVPGALRGDWLLATGLLGAAAAWLVRRRERMGDPVLESRPSAACGGLLLVLGALGLLGEFGASAPVYPPVLAAAAFGILAFDREVRRPALFVALLFALVTGVGTASGDRGGAWLALVGFALVAGGGRVLARDWTFGGGLVFLLGAMFALARGLALDVLEIDEKWMTAILLALTAGVFLAPRVKALAVTPAAGYTVGAPLAGLAGVVLTVLGFVIASSESRTDGLRLLTEDAGVLAVNAVATVGLGLAVGSRARGVMRAIWPALAAGLAVSLYPPLNRLLHPGEIAWWRPDLEVALVGAGLALTMAPAGARAIRPASLGRARSVPYAFAAVAIALTAFEPRDLTTSLALFAIAGIAFILLLRDRIGEHADALGGALVLASFALTIYLVPDTGRPHAEILPLLASVMVILSIVFLTVAARLGRVTSDALAVDAGRRLARVATIGLLIAVGFIAANVLALPDTPADGVGLALATLAMVGAAALAWILAVRRGAAVLVHVAVLAGLALHAYVAYRTTLMAGLDGYHLHLLAAVGAGLLVLSARAGRPLRSALEVDALLLPVLVGGAALLDLVGAYDMAGRGAPGLFLAAAVYGVAAYREGRPPLGWLSLALVNLALFSVWRHRGIVDPAFYGIPTGLSLVLGSEVARRGDSKAEGVWLLASGLVILYGSVAVQVLRIEEPTHALVLFGLGLLSVGWGAIRARNDVLLAGTAAVVIDVVAYLARHGFARDFVGAGLLLGAGLTVLAGGALAARRRRAASGLKEDLDPEPHQDEPSDPLGPGPDAGGEEASET